MDVGVPFLAALVVTFVLMRPTIGLLVARHVLDVPNDRSSHTVAVPRGGGIAVLGGLAAGALAGLFVHDKAAAPWNHAMALALVLAIGTTGYAALGLRDDLGDLSVSLRLGAQAAMAIALVAVTAWAAPATAVLVTVVVGTVWVTGYVNAFNFMDGVNGVAAVVAVLSGGWFCLLGVHGHDALSTAAGASVAGAALAFLPWNAPRARVFLGDAGSYGLGVLIALLALLTALRDDNVWWGVAPAMVYVADTSWTLLRRVRLGEPILQAHRTHVYQRLTDRGFSHTATTAVVGGFTAVILAATWLLPTPVAVIVGLAIAAGYLMLPSMVTRRAAGVVR
jgi:UDP-GlcNAc:undecaprenyl-phosphate/decaprenyl-phosphate GlcNAc-1-phosphate transferase